jgi:hypothetical protein
MKLYATGGDIMKRIELTETETLTLVDVLESALSDLMTEAAATENRELRATLKERKAIIREVLARLAA